MSSDLIGAVFGDLTVIERVPLQGAKRIVYGVRCQCSCGNERVLRIGNLTRGGATSCGCRRGKAGVANQNYRHGYSRHPSYPRYVLMRRRCENPSDASYSRYGGRGIRVDLAFATPEAFLAWLDANLGPCPQGYSLDRIDNDGDYAPGNLRWADASTQARNQRRRQAVPDAA